jgi:hypothetical protein
MNFEDEPYVRLYQRDTKTWLKWQWEGQSVWSLLSRKLDRAGVLDDVTDPVADVALVTGLPESVVSIGLPRIIESGTLEHRGSLLVAPRFVEGQTATKSDRLRSAELRKRRRDQARSGELGEPSGEVVEPPIVAANDASHESRDVSAPTRGVTPAPRNVSAPSRGITESHAPSRGVTPSLALPSLALQDPPLPPEGGVPAAEPEKKSSKRRRSGGTPGVSPCPLDFQPDATTQAKATSLGFSSKLEHETRETFVDWWRSKDLRMADWQATYRNWLRKEAKTLGLKPPPADTPQRRLWLEQKAKAEAVPVKVAPHAREIIDAAMADMLAKKAPLHAAS